MKVSRNELLWVAAPLALGAAALSEGWSGAGALGLLLTCAVLPVAVIGGCLRLGVASWVAALVPTVVGGGVALGLAASAAHVAVWHEIGRALRTLLAVPSPAHATFILLLPGILLCLVTSSVVGVRLFIAGRGRVAGVVAGVVLYAGGQLLTAGTGDPHGLLAAGLVAAALLGWQLSGDGSVRPVRLAVVILAVIPPAVIGLGGAAGGYQPRAHISQPRTVLQATDPLASLTLWTEHPDLTLFQASVHGTDRLHVATLAGYDGQGWQDTGSFVPLDQYASPDLPIGSHRLAVSATVQLGQIGGPLLPTVSGTGSLSKAAGLIDPSSGDAAVIDGTAPGLSYAVGGTRPNPAPASLASAVEPVVPAQYLDVPAPPTALVTYARQVTASATTPLQQAVALEAAVAQGRNLKVTAPGGSGYSRLLTFLFRPASEGGQTGDSEQFAASFAVLGRLVGLPTRLVVGFQLPSTSGAGQRVTGADARAWPEVYLGGVGWLPFDPTPGAGTSGDAAVRSQALAAVNTPGHPAVPPITRPRTRPAAPAAAPAKVSSHLTRTVVIGVVIGLLLVLTVLLARRLARRRRRRSAGAPGAWADVLALRRKTGMAFTPGTSGTTIAESFGVITPHARELATLVVVAADRATFGVDPVDADDDAWQAVAELRREVRRNKPARR